MKVIITIIIIVIIAILGWLVLRDGSEGMDVFQQENPAQTKNKYDKVPDFSLEDYDGNIVSLSDFEGKALIINSWAVWCPFCKAELSDFAKLQKEFADDIVVIAIDRQESLEKAKGFSDEIGVTDNMVFLLDPSDSFYKSIGAFTMPETIFVDKDGNIIVHKRGPMKLDEMREKTQFILK